MNTVNITGRLAMVSELKHTRSNTPFINLKVAVERDYTPKGQPPKIDTFSAVAWRKDAEYVAKHLTEIQKVAITGHLQSRQYTDRQNVDHDVTEIVVDKIEFAGGKFDAPAPQELEEPEEPPLPEEPPVVPGRDDKFSFLDDIEEFII